MTATMQAAGLSTVSNVCAQFIEAYQEQVGISLNQLNCVVWIIEVGRWA